MIDDHVRFNIVYLYILITKWNIISSWKDTISHGAQIKRFVFENYFAGKLSYVLVVREDVIRNVAG